MMGRDQKGRTRLLTGITLFALIVHVAFLFYLQQMEMSLPVYAKKAISSFCELGEGELFDSEKELALAEVFQQLESNPVDTHEIEYNVDSLDPDFVSNEIAPPEILLPNADLQIVAIDPMILYSDQMDRFDPMPLESLASEASSRSPLDTSVELQGEELIDQVTRSTNLVQRYAMASDGPFEAISAGDQSDSAYGMIGSNNRHQIAPGETSQGTIAGSNDFHLEVYYQKLKNNRGYAFQASLVPKKEVIFKRIRQNLFFIIDRSYSIDKIRYDEAKVAVSKALELLKPGDTFNILMFDKKVRRLAEKNLLVNDQTIEQAIEFLSNEKHGGLFSSTDLYTSLEKIIPRSVADTEVNTAILFSDGITSLTQKDQRQAISTYTFNNNGKVSLYCISSGKANNTALLALLSHFNKGKLVHTQSFQQQPAYLVKLMKEIRNPIGKEIVVNAVTDGQVRVQLLPEGAKRPDLYEGTPFVVYGTVNCLDDFYLFLQGKYYDKWLDIKQKVVFAEAKQVSSGIELELAQFEAYDQYGQFLYNGDTAYLREANSRLTPFNLTPVFQ
jgi:hypothetical protein